MWIMIIFYLDLCFRIPIMKYLIYLSIALGVVLADKVYIPDEGNVVGISTNWYKPKACTAGAWSDQTDATTNIFYWAVCFSVNCLLETTTSLLIAC